MATQHERLHDSLEFVLTTSRETIGSLPAEALDRFLARLESAGRVFVYGTGRSGFVAKAFAVRLAHLGYQTYVIGETITAPVQAKDLVVLISGSGETYPVTMTAEIARTIGAQVVSLTREPHSKVANTSDVVLSLAPPRDTNGRRGDLAPLGTLFETCAWILLDGIVSDLMRRRGQSEEMMRQRHATLE